MKKQIQATITFDFDNDFDSKVLAKYLGDRLKYTLESNQFPDFTINYFMEVN
jgi:hypothetical protein